jgi:hypothetical protein
MPYNGSGVFLRTQNWTADAAAGIKIVTDRHDNEDDNFASGLSQVICRDGQSQITQDIPWNGRRITGLANPVDPQDAVTKHWASDTIRAFSEGIRLTGATVGGISKAVVGFSEAVMSIVGRNAGQPAGSKRRIAFNSSVGSAGADLAYINDDGTVTGFMSFIDRYYTANATWTKPTIADNGIVPKYVEVWVQGAGGGGGGAAASGGATPPNVMVGAGGGGGAYSHKVYNAADLGATVGITIGARGTAGPGTPGTPGGTGAQSSFGAQTALGGTGGTNTANNAVAQIAPGGAGATTGAGSPDELFNGSPGQAGIKFGGTPLVGVGGAGGAGGCGAGGSRAAGSPAQPGVSADPGAGGNGGYSVDGGGGSGGGAGGLGFVHVREWY